MTTDPNPHNIAFIGGGNMASAIIGGLLKQGWHTQALQVIEPFAPARENLKANLGIEALATAGPSLKTATVIVWAVKPQAFQEAALQTKPHLSSALHLSVAAGIPSVAIASWLENERVIRTMPNTPALVGQGISGLYARDAVSAADKALAQTIINTTGTSLWVDEEKQLDAVTALSGSGPAYVFYFLEAMVQAGTAMGLSPEQAKQLSLATFSGACELARSSATPIEALRQQVTSKGGTTYAALTSMENDHIKSHFIKAIHAAQQRAQELGNEFGAA